MSSETISIRYDQRLPQQSQWSLVPRRSAHHSETWQNPPVSPHWIAGAQGTFRNLKEDVDFYDRWTKSSKRWGSRRAVGHGIDRACDFLSLGEQSGDVIKPQSRFAEAPLTAISNNALSYRQLLNLGKSTAVLAQEHALNPKAYEYYTVAWNELFKPGKYRAALAKNYQQAFKASEVTGGLTTFQYLTKNPKGYVTNTLINNNLRRITDTICEGKNPGTGVMSALGVAVMGYDILSTTYEAYQEAKSQEDGSFMSKMRTLGATAGTFVIKSAKNILCWEAGSLGFALGASLFCVGTAGATLLSGVWLSILGGILVGALMATATNKLLSQIIPDPKTNARTVY